MVLFGSGSEPDIEPMIYVFFTNPTRVQERVFPSRSQNV